MSSDCDRCKDCGLKNGCRNFVTHCKDCGQVVNSTKVPTNQGYSGWIDRNVQFPDAEKIFCCSGNEVFICELIESKLGNYYYSTDTKHIALQNMPEWTYWMPLPQPPNDCNCAVCDEETRQILDETYHKPIEDKSEIDINEIMLFVITKRIFLINDYVKQQLENVNKRYPEQYMCPLILRQILKMLDVGELNGYPHKFPEN